MKKKEKKSHPLLSFLMAGAGTAAAVLAFLQKGMLKVLLLRLWKHKHEERKKEKRRQRRLRRAGVSPAGAGRRMLPENLGVRRPGDPLPLWRSGNFYFNLSCILGLVSVVFRITAAVLDGLEAQKK